MCIRDRAAIGPLFTTVENFVIDGVQWLIAIPFGIGSFIMGGLYATTVVSGIHHMYTIIDLGQLSAYGLTFWLPLASAANVAQGGAALAVAIKTRNKKLKSMALPASLSAFMGITEPAIFGVNLRFFRPFIACLLYTSKQPERQEVQRAQGAPARGTDAECIGCLLYTSRCV